MEKLRRITINGIVYPIKMDMNVLQHIQENYGTINEFERDVLGYKYMLDRNGKQILTEEGKPAMYKTEPSIKAIKIVLPVMINEGLEIESEERGKEFTPVSEEEIIRNCDVSFSILADIIHEEFAKCFAVKK